jgi:hypothetical protein
VSGQDAQSLSAARRPSKVSGNSGEANEDIKQSS